MKYLLRLINTSVDTILVFAIDSHNITVVADDFVAISPYNTDHVVVGIGKFDHSSYVQGAEHLLRQRYIGTVAVEYRLIESNIDKIFIISGPFLTQFSSCLLNHADRPILRKIPTLSLRCSSR